MKRTIAAVVAMSAACALFAEDETEVAEDDAVKEVKAALAAQTNPAPLKAFTTLPTCRRIAGRVSVRKPGGDWEAAEEGRFYPLGSSYRTERGGSLVLAFGSGSTATIAEGMEFGTRSQGLNVYSRTLVPVRGTIALKLPDNLPEGAFFVAAPGFTIKNPAGEAVIVFKDKGDGDEAEISCKTGSFGIEGRHFDIPALHAADTVRIRTSRDQLFTSLNGVSGNYVVNVDQGLCTHEEFAEDGTLKPVVEKGSLAWRLSPRTQVVINRSVPAIGERMSVHTMTFDAAGILKNERAFSEGRAEVNSGELVPQTKSTANEIAKRAAEITEGEAPEAKAEAAEAGDAPAEEEKSEETTSDEEE